MYIQFHAAGNELTPELQKYAYRKLAPLQRRIPRALRRQARISIFFTRRTVAKQPVSTCKIVCTVGNFQWTAHESTQHLYAALDIAVVHIEQQWKQYRATRNLSLASRTKNILRADWY